jgi:uncharacterized membrane protein YeiH
VEARFTLPIYIDLSATCLYAMTGALLAIRRHYDVVGMFVLALVSGVGGGLIREGIFIQSGPPLAMTDARYLLVILAGCIVAALFRKHMDRLQTAFLFADALGFGAYAVVGVERALTVNLPMLAAIMIGVVTASGGGLLRDVLVREEPLLFKPGQLYVVAALLGATVFAVLLVRFKKPPESAALLAIGCSFCFRALAIVFNWKTVSLSESPIPFSATFQSSMLPKFTMFMPRRAETSQPETSVTDSPPPPSPSEPAPPPQQNEAEGNPPPPAAG